MRLKLIHVRLIIEMMRVKQTHGSPDGYTRRETYKEGSVIPSPLDGVNDVDVSQLLAGITN